MSVKIFVCAHKPFQNALKNPVYSIICEEGDSITSEVEIIKIKPHISNIGFSEWSKFYEVYKREDLPDYIGLEHYRRILLLGKNINDIPDPEELFKDCDLIVGRVINVGNIRQQYANCHNVKDLDLCGDIIEKDFPEFKEAWKKVTNQGIFFICNNCVMKKEDFLEFCDFLFGVLFKFCERNGIDPSSDQSFYDYIDKDIQKYSKRHKPEDSTFREQARIGGFLSERLFNVWAAKKGLKIKSVPVVDSK